MYHSNQNTHVCVINTKVDKSKFLPFLLQSLIQTNQNVFYFGGHLNKVVAFLPFLGKSCLTSVLNEFVGQGLANQVPRPSCVSWGTWLGSVRPSIFRYIWSGVDSPTFNPRNVLATFCCSSYLALNIIYTSLKTFWDF